MRRRGKYACEVSFIVHVPTCLQSSASSNGRSLLIRVVKSTVNNETSSPHIIIKISGHWGHLQIQISTPDSYQWLQMTSQFHSTRYYCG